MRMPSLKSWAWKYYIIGAVVAILFLKGTTFEKTIIEMKDKVVK